MKTRRPCKRWWGRCALQTGSTFAVSPTAVTMNEGTVTTLTAQAGGAQKLYWIRKQNGVETVIATNQFTLDLAAGRVTGSRSYRCNSRHLSDGNQDRRYSRQHHRRPAGPGVHSNGPRHLGWPPDHHRHS